MNRTAATGVVALISLVLVAGCGASKKRTTSAKATPLPSLPAGLQISPNEVGSGAHAVLFEALGSDAADVAYVVGDWQAQDSGVALPWQKTVRTDASTIVASMMMVAKQAGTASCRLTIDGKLVQESKAEAGQTMVTCKTA